MRLTEHVTLGEMGRTSVKTGEGNLPPSAEVVANLRRVCGWLERLRQRYNERYVSQPSAISLQTSEEEGIVVNSGYRGEAVNRAVGGSATSNHLTGCAADIRVAGMEQLLRYAVILLDISDETGEAFDELLLERNARGAYWLHFAVRPADRENRRKVRLIK